MNTVRPGAITVMIGGALLLLSSFLDWQAFGPFGFNAWDYGLTGFFLLLLSGVVVALAAIRAFSPDTDLPDSLLGFTQDQLLMSLGAVALFLAFASLFRNEGFQIGTILAVLSSGAIVVGGYLESQAPAPQPPPPQPPQQQPQQPQQQPPPPQPPQPQQQPPPPQQPQQDPPPPSS